MQVRSRRQLLVAIGAAALAPATAGCLPLGRPDGSGRESGPIGPVAQTLGPDGTSVWVGDPSAGLTVTLFEDPSCPACAEFETTGTGPRLLRMAAAGELQLRFALGSFLGPGSKRAVNALRAALDKGRFVDLHQAVYDGQASAKQRGGFSTNGLLDLAATVEGLRDADFDDAVRTARHREFVEAADRALSASWIRGTPSMEVNGRPVAEGDRDVMDDGAALRRYLKSASERPARH
ncbi:thioredoxin domain-containing protein [Streptomyces sp. NPDC047718]|uniref:DsbA family protein n=1 Tax=Streptomyces sp. NPDC047718 TaxID=3155479 RepID=UPI0033C550B9